MQNGPKWSDLTDSRIMHESDIDKESKTEINKHTEKEQIKPKQAICGSCSN